MNGIMLIKIAIGSDVQAESKGVLIFAYDSKLDYVSIATVAAKLAKKHLGLPVTLVTNKTDINDSVFDQVIYKGLSGPQYERSFNFTHSTERTVWHNQNRSSAYELSPYDRTLLIDADYLMFNDSLGKLFETELDFACFDDVYDLSGDTMLEKGAVVGKPGVKMQWATVVYFRKCNLAQGVFEFMSLIKENYTYYSALYDFSLELFRNDYTLSIALQTLTGYSESNFSKIPGKLITANTGTEILDVRDNGEVVLSWNSKDGKKNVTKIQNANVHIMNKTTIVDPIVLEKLHKVAT